MRGRNTKNLKVELDSAMANYQQKRYVVMKFIHDEKHIVFNNVGKGRKRKEVFNGVGVVIGLFTSTLYHLIRRVLLFLKKYLGLYKQYL